MISVPDFANAAFEASGGAFIAMSILRLYRDKVVRGVSPLHAGFFTVWGFYNLFYYPYLGQWLSFGGCCLIVIANAIWLGQIFYYGRREATEVEPIELQDARVIAETTPRYRHIDK